MLSSALKPLHLTLTLDTSGVTTGTKGATSSSHGTAKPPHEERTLSIIPNFQNFIHGLKHEATSIPNVPLVGQADHIIELLERIEARLVTIEAK